MLDLSAEEEALLSYLAIQVDANLAKLSAAEQGVTVSTQMFREGWRLVLRSKGLDPDLYRATWDGRAVVVEPVAL